MKTNKQSTIVILTLSLLCVTGKASEAQGTTQKNEKLNILFIAIDDLNDWTGMLKGNPQAKTPHMEKLASQGIVFTNAHCAAPACGPSRSAIMSGIRPSTSGNYINKSSFIHNPILNNSVLLPEFFQQNGYYVCGAGKLFHGYHFNEEVKGRGFDEYYPSKTQDLPSFEGLKFSSKLPLGGWARQADWGPCHPDVTVDDHPDGKTANWATDKLLGGELQEPFFLGAGIFQPHLPNYAPQEYFDRFPLEDIKLPEGYRENDLEDVPAAHAKMAHNPWLKRIRETNQWKPAIQAYLACTAMVDDLIGQIVGALEKSKYADNTIIVLWSDHGFQLGEKERWSKYSLWERATRVNLVWVAPGVITPGASSERPVNLLDIYPTLASLTGCEPPENQLEGNDLSILMRDPEASWSKTTVTTFGYKNYGVRSERYRYIVYADGTEELYDHETDKWEWTNLANNPEYAAIKKKMRKELPTHHEPSGVTYVPPKRIR
ncbi:sulfatase [Planctomycetaceae bacterium]|nr:sulfatase [Planctomycetaceae bacterium]MDC0307720.1 sulfatase [Planctomycetaceae bacterium]